MPARYIARMSAITGRVLGALFLSALVAGAAPPAETGLRRECRRQCDAAAGGRGDRLLVAENVEVNQVQRAPPLA